MESFQSRKRHQVAVGAALSAAVLTLSNLPAQAQETEIEALRAQIAELTARLGKIEQQQIDAADAAKKVGPVTTRSGLGLNVSGTFQVQSNLFQNESGASFPRQQDTFRLRRAELRVTAPNITSRVSGTVQFDFARGLSGRNGQATESSLSFGSAALQELQLSYLLKKAAAPNTDNHYIDFGQFKIPFGYEGDLVSSSALPFVERALMFRARDVANGGAGDVRDTGIQARGSFSDGQIAYWLGVFNGLGERQNQQASGDPKAIVGRLAWRPKSIQGLQVGTSFARGNTRIAPSSATDPINSLTSRFDRQLYNVFAAYKRDKWSLQSEYTQGKGQAFIPTNPAGPPPAGVYAAPEREFRGYYASAGYLLTPKIEGVLRYDYFNFDRNLSDTAVRELSAGINYYIKGNNAKIQANIVRVQGASGLIPTAGDPLIGFGSGSQGPGFRNDRTELRLQGQVAF